VKPWKGHDDFYACARFEKMQKKKEKKGKKKLKDQQVEQEKDKKRQALERYIGYYDKYLEYDNFLKNSDSLKEEMKKRMQTLQEEHTILAEVKFISKAVQTLLESYLTLKYSFVYTYYLEDGTFEKEIFTILQDELIKSTQSLREIVDCSEILEKRTEAVDLTKLVQKKMESLITVGGDEHNI